MTIHTVDSLKAIIAHYYTTVDTADHEAVVALFHPEAVYRRPGYAPIQEHAALRTFYGSQRVIASGRHEIRELIVDRTTFFDRPAV